MYNLFYEAGFCIRTLPRRPPELTNADRLYKCHQYCAVHGNARVPFASAQDTSWSVSLVRNSYESFSKLDSNRWAACLSARGLAVTLKVL